MVVVLVVVVPASPVVSVEGAAETILRFFDAVVTVGCLPWSRSSSRARQKDGAGEAERVTAPADSLQLAGR